jgi:hypothetical protein
VKEISDGEVVVLYCFGGTDKIGYSVLRIFIFLTLYFILSNVYINYSVSKYVDKSFESALPWIQ